MVDLPLSPEIIRQIDSRALEARKIKKVTIRNQAFTRRKSVALQLKSVRVLLRTRKGSSKTFIMA